MSSLQEVVRTHVGDPAARIATQHVEHLGHTALSTAELRRIHGTTTDGRPWSVVAKSIRSMRHWPELVAIPPELRERAVEGYPWRADADVYLSPPPLPEGLRLPEVYLVEDLGDDRLVLWMEDVRQAAGEWDLERYRRAARLLGELAALRPSPDIDAGMRIYLGGVVTHAFVPMLREPAFWQQPLVARNADPLLRADLLALAGRIPDLLKLSEGLPHFHGHGDAGPQNLLVPAEGPAEFVAIDWSWPYPGVAGFDLGQLLVGRAHDGEVDPAELAAIHDTILPAYASALPGVDVETGYVVSLVLRSAWTALPLDRAGEAATPATEEFFRRRAGLARFIADLGRSL
ncbi:hypothetical protein [Nonomuraea sp. NPDC050310]|uniref:hypothetical protein n=1 Tax=unclassified Nonomuraea TaxID=2593643 RepID=UPI0033C7C542